MRNGKRIVDIHNHFYEKPWLDYCAKRTKDPVYEWTSPKTGVFRVGGAIAGHVDSAGTFDGAARNEDMDKYGIDTQIVSHTCPGVMEIPAKEAVVWAKKVNDELAGLTQKYPGRFYFLATMAAQNIKESLKEMDRAYNELGCVGFQMFSNVNGLLISDPQFWPIYEKAAELGVPIKIHPSFIALTANAQIAAKLPVQLFGFTLDTTMAVTAMIYQGVFEKYPNLKVIHSHLGGMAPYMMGRIDNAFNRFAKEWNIEIKRLPSETYKQHIYIDTISLHVPSIKCALEFMGIDHVIFGTDYPHRASGTVPQNFETLEKVGLSEAQLKKIYSENTMKLFKIK